MISQIIFGLITIGGNYCFEIDPAKEQPNCNWQPCNPVNNEWMFKIFSFGSPFFFIYSLKNNNKNQWKCVFTPKVKEYSSVICKQSNFQLLTAS